MFRYLYFQNYMFYLYTNSCAEYVGDEKFLKGKLIVLVAPMNLLDCTVVHNIEFDR